MTGLTLEVNTDKLYRALLEQPNALKRNVRNAIDRITLEIARGARRHAPKAFSTLTNSIKSTMISDYEGIVSAGTNYAQAVEEGTQGGAMPPVQNIQDWIRVKRIVPNDPDMDERDLAFIIARSIAAKGTPAQPYFAPALAEQRASAERRLNAAIDAALAA